MFNETECDILISVVIYFWWRVPGEGEVTQLQISCLINIRVLRPGLDLTTFWYQHGNTSGGWRWYCCNVSTQHTPSIVMCNIATGVLTGTMPFYWHGMYEMYLAISSSLSSQRWLWSADLDNITNSVTPVLTSKVTNLLWMSTLIVLVAS